MIPPAQVDTLCLSGSQQQVPPCTNPSFVVAPAEECCQHALHIALCICACRKLMPRHPPLCVFARAALELTPLANCFAPLRLQRNHANTVGVTHPIVCLCTCRGACRQHDVANTPFVVFPCACRRMSPTRPSPTPCTLRAQLQTLTPPTSRSSWPCACWTGSRSQDTGE